MHCAAGSAGSNPPENLRFSGSIGVPASHSSRGVAPGEVLPSGKGEQPPWSRPHRTPEPAPSSGRLKDRGCSERRTRPRPDTSADDYHGAHIGRGDAGSTASVPVVGWIVRVRACRSPPSEPRPPLTPPTDLCRSAFPQGCLHRERPRAAAEACDQHAPAVAAPDPKSGGSLPVTAAIAGAAARCRSDARSEPRSSGFPGGRGCDRSGRIGCDRRPLSRSQTGAASTWRSTGTPRRRKGRQ